ncbi:lysylphosphatidylglycerol synthase domain-containing protein [Nocardioides sp. GY 10127]|uniref:lysylphosphatidylglycerol synthase domain-containing protein n=1 Tax=Nocardioides sp. GY 10127 TaxID=2569762 RepID=UPI0010A84E9F|nr:lysylphosphatidylglycerol synthase domain-containing protein [Nocardioides sp. GY 10127]TIC79292.1 flippase-like domain-containing protein [Nocardioides sp. GY 10127]
MPVPDLHRTTPDAPVGTVADALPPTELAPSALPPSELPPTTGARPGLVPRLARRLALLGVAGGAVAVLAPRLAGVPWASVLAVVTGVPAVWLVGLVLLWAAGLATHTVTLTAAMPGLTHRRAATLSLTGSFVANVLPLGGAAGVAANGLVARTWGYSGRDVAAYTVVTNVWDVLAKLVVAALAAAYVLRAGLALPGLGTLGAAAGVLLVAVGVLLASDRATRLLVRPLDALPRLLLRGRGGAWGTELLRTRRTAARTARARWAGLTVGMVGYTALLALLLAACLHVTGAAVPLVGLAAGFAVERVLTLAALTPGGLGTVELGLTAVLVSAGADPVGAVAGVLLYRLLTFALEIPVGGTWLAAWWWSARRRTRLGAGAAGTAATAVAR